MADNELNVELLESSFALLADRADELVANFYDRLFSTHPEVKPLFAGVEMNAQQKKLISALQLVINSIRSPDKLVPALQLMGKRHQDYGVVADQYPIVAETLLAVMEEMAGELWTEELHACWSQALGQVAEIMLQGYEKTDSGDIKMSDNTSDDIQKLQEELKQLQHEKQELTGKVDAIEKVQASIEFELDGTIITANDNFLNTVGYSLDEIQGKHHSMFVEPDYARSAEYKKFWADLASGQFQTGQYRRFNSQGEEVWLNASYNPVMDENGKPYKVVKFATDGTELRNEQQSSIRLQAAVENCQSAMIMVDRDFVVTYANEATAKLLAKYESSFKEVWPSFDSSKMMGICIDMFHKNPEHQRRLLDDPSNLPYKTDITIKDLTFSLCVTAQRDADGNYIGNTLEWQDVTETRKKETEVARLQSAVDGAQANLMLCDADLNITYANPAVVEMLRVRQNELRQIWPSLDVNNLIGQNIDQFHKNPAHQRSLLADVSRLPASAEIKVGDLEFKVNATAVLAADGTYMGNMVEWQDITDQKQTERAIQNLIEGASRGELDRRIDNVEQSEGFMRILGEGINSLLDSVVGPFKEAMGVMQSLADGDLTKSMEGEYSGQFAEMRDAANTCSANLMRMVNEISENAANINTSAGEIAQGNTDLSQRTEEQASSLEETASSMEELTGTVRQNAENANQANQLASGAREQAEKGGEVVAKAISAMSEINSSSRKISDIIGVIDEIAFQTNLLALNAAVEAARAGEQGRGFAVVASEVRNLAQRSAGAAKEIKTLINDSVQKVDEGSRLVDESGDTLTEIVNSVKKVSDIIGEIAAASNEQSAGIEQVNKAITQMDQVTQQNAALVEEAAAASESMDEQSRALTALMQNFYVGNNPAAAVATRAPKVERRSESDRPWSAPKQAAAAPAPTPMPRAAAGGGADDGEWEDF